MRIFISWTGNKSNKAAQLLGAWLKRVIQAVEPWFSGQMDKGLNWLKELHDGLDETKIGIICLSNERIGSDWVYFEAGALSKIKDAHVCTFLLDLDPTEVKQPLSQFQHTVFAKEDVRKLIETINNKMVKEGLKGLKQKDLDEVFDAFWPKLEKQLQDLLDAYKKTEEVVFVDQSQIVETADSNKTTRKPADVRIELQGFRNGKIVFAWNGEEEEELKGLREKLLGTPVRSNSKINGKENKL